VSGPAAFAVEAATAIRADVQFLSIVSSALISAFLFWRYRSLLLLATVAVRWPPGAGRRARHPARVRLGPRHHARLRHHHARRGRRLPADAERPAPAGRGAARHRPADRADAGLAVCTGALGLTAMLLSSFPGSPSSACSRPPASWCRRRDALAPAAPAARRPSSEQRVPDAWMAGTDRLRRLRPVLSCRSPAAASTSPSGRPAWETDLANLSPGARILAEPRRRAAPASSGAPTSATSSRSPARTRGRAPRAIRTPGRRAGPLRDAGKRWAAPTCRAAYLPDPAESQLARQATLPPLDELRARLGRRSSPPSVPAPTRFDPFLA
jgi:hypothetical protein